MCKYRHKSQGSTGAPVGFRVAGRNKAADAPRASVQVLGLGVGFVTLARQACTCIHDACGAEWAVRLRWLCRLGT